jgi:hypothetical protein
VAGIRSGQRFGAWTTTGQARIGGGGNGEVWAVTGDDGRIGAIKILIERRGREGAYRLGRFKDEIGFLIAHPDFPGILPLLDSHIADDPAERSWYVIPVAVPIRQALGDDPEPAAVVAAVAEVASTLEALVAEGVAHRDIKPDNLFRLGDHWVIGDFGLVTYPEKDPRTEHGRKLGPTDYMAPEMREDADKAAPLPADVWALAKTLWVLLTDESLPLPGTHQADEPAHALVERITFTFAAELDLLLERATQIEPQDRASMTALAQELHACLAEPPEVRRPASIAELHARANALTAKSRQNVSDTQGRRDRVAGVWTELEQAVTEAGYELGHALTFDVRAHESGYHASAMLGRPPFVPYAAYGTGCLLFPPGQARPCVEVVVAAAMRMLRDDDRTDFAGLLQVDRIFDGGLHDVHIIWAETYRDVPIGSAQQVNVIAEIRTSIINGFEEAMRLAISILAATDRTGMEDN